MAYIGDKKVILSRVVERTGGTTDYDDLTNTPAINQDLSADGFIPVENTYYRHTGASTNNYTNGIIYLYNGTEYKAIDGSGSSTTVDNALDANSTNPVQNKVVKEALDGKLDKITTTGASRMYTITGAGKQGTVNYGQTPVANWIPMYEPNMGGALQVGPPSKPVHATPRKYVDSRTGVSANTLYSHTFIGTLNDNSNFQFEIYSNKSEIYIRDNYLELYLITGEDMDKNVFNVHNIANNNDGSGVINPTIEYQSMGNVEGSDPVQVIYRITKIGNFDFSSVSEILLVSTAEV